MSSTTAKSLFFGALTFIIVFVGIVFVIKPTVQTAQPAQAEATLPAGVTKFDDGITSCYVYDHVGWNNEIGGISCVKN